MTAKNFNGDVHAWCERHDQHDPAAWLALVLDGTYSAEEMRAAILANRPPKEILELPEYGGEISLSSDTVVGAKNFGRFVQAGGTIYKRGFHLEVRERPDTDAQKETP